MPDSANPDNVIGPVEVPSEVITYGPSGGEKVLTVDSLPQGLLPSDLVLVRNGFSHFQKLQRLHAIYPNVGKNLNYVERGLASEFGEFEGKLKKNERDGTGEITPELIEKLELEVGDMLWYLAAICWELGTDIGRCASRNLTKIYSRVERGTIHGDGDNR